MTTAISPAPSTALFQRFAWKEYRMLRGFWLAVTGLGMLMQWTTTQLIFNTGGSSSSMLLVAWGAAALYAIGAAITLFSAEREEQTHAFLMRLPGRWLPMFTAKVSLAIGTAFGLGMILCVTGTWIAGGIWPSAVEFQNAVAIGGVAVLEATAWGLLFSLCMKQPLLAAVSAIGAASFAAQLAIATTPTANHAFSIVSYREAVPARLLLTLAVFAIDLWLAARWLKTTSSPDNAKTSSILAAFATNVWLGARFFQFATRYDKQRDLSAEKSTTAAATSRGMRRAQIARLLWQTWGESWQTALAAIPIAIFLMISLALPLALFQNSAYYADLPLPVLTLLFLPALLGSLVFRADQRANHRQFLVAHAARPRYVWLARQIFWGTGLFAITLAISAAVWLTIVWESGDILHRILQRGEFAGGFPGGTYVYQSLDKPWQLATLFDQLILFATQFTSATWTSFFTAYALGQFCSLMLRREVLAGLLAILLSVILAAWVMLAGFWQLSPWWFVLPIGIGAMLATWLRMPDWIVARNRPITWALPLASIVVPLIYVVATLPSTRLAQLQDQPWHPEFMEQVRKYEASRPAGAETTRDYERLYASILNSAKPSEEEIAALIKITQKAECRFPISTDLLGYTFSQADQIGYLRKVLHDDAKRLQSQEKIERALEGYLAIIRMHTHILSYQLSSTVEFIERSGYLLDSLSRRYQLNIDKLILSWAQHPNQTSELLRKAITELQSYPAARIVDPILADREQIRAVLTGEDPPSFLNEKNPRWSGYLAFLANRLPWERQRALLALDIRTSQILDHVRAGHDGNKYGYSDAAARLQLVAEWHMIGAPMPHQSTYGHNWHAYRRATQSAFQASTSYLMSQELNSRTNIRLFLIQTLDARTKRLGLITQLALLAYRLDHQRYPESLLELVPDYLNSLQFDPSSDGPLEYRPQGFDLPLVRYASNSTVRKSEFSSATIPAHTPLLWSAGLGNYEPHEGVITLTLDGENNLPENDDDEKEVVEVIRLELALDFYRRSPIIFTLPKIKPPADSPANNQPKENNANQVEE